MTLSQYNEYLILEHSLYDDPTQLSPLLKPIIEEDIEELNQLKFSKEFALNISDQYGNTPLHIAVITEKLITVEYLLAQDVVFVDAKNFYGQTPIFNAVRTNKMQIFKRLLEAGASVNIKDNQQNTALHLSVSYPEIAHVLIQNGADIDVTNFYKDTPLHNAVTVENLETVCMMLYYNCDTDVQNSEGNTPFMDALIFENIDVQTALFEYIVDFNRSSTDGDTILTLALTYDSPFVEEILARGAKVNRRALESSLMSNAYGAFVTIWKSIPNMELENSTLLDKFAYGMRHRNLLKYIDLIMENSDEGLLKSLANCFNCQDSYTDFVEKCANNQGLEELTKLTCVLLEYNCKFMLRTVFQIYVHFGYCQLFKYFLYMDYSIDFTDCDIALGWIIPKYIYDINIDMETLCKEIVFHSSDRLQREAAIRSLEYSVDSCLINLLIISLDDRSELISICEKLPSVPSLLQLSRDKSRKYIVDKLQFTRPSQYLTFINNLDIATVYKQILTLERRIYNFNVN